MSATLLVTRRNARFQQWQALLANRGKRNRNREFLVQGVRPVTLAVEHGWEVRTLLFDAGARLSAWATEMLDRSSATRVAVATELMRELGEKVETAPELLAVVGMRGDDLGRIPTPPNPLVVVLDRVASPGNLGTLIRSADAFGAAGVIVTGHAADVYDPKTIRSSTGSLFALPVVRVPSHREVLEWVGGLRATGVRLSLIGTDEHGDAEVADIDLTCGTAVVVGNETVGLSAAWREHVERLVRIPITGAASSLNAAVAGSIVLYEAARQRSRAGD